MTVIVHDTYDTSGAPDVLELSNDPRRREELAVTQDLIIEATALHKTYRTGALTVQALRGVDFVVRRGEMGPARRGRMWTVGRR